MGIDENPRRTQRRGPGAVCYLNSSIRSLSERTVEEELRWKSEDQESGFPGGPVAEASHSSAGPVPGQGTRSRIP